MKNKMPAFLAKKKRDPKSTAPGKNTKGRTVTRSKSKKEESREQDRGRGGQQVAAVPTPNNADAALAVLTKSRPKRGGGY